MGALSEIKDIINIIAVKNPEFEIGKFDEEDKINTKLYFIKFNNRTFWLRFDISSYFIQLKLKYAGRLLYKETIVRKSK